MGDALGGAVEFLSVGQIRSVFGDDGITDFSPAYGRTGAITDDTQMALFTAEGLLRAWVSAAGDGAGDPVPLLRHAYLRWLRTQEEPWRPAPGDTGADGWLLGIPALWSRRAPGLTCLSGLHASQARHPYPNNDCLKCHAEAIQWAEQELHVENKEALFAGEMSCMDCHGPMGNPAHVLPEEAE